MLYIIFFVLKVEENDTSFRENKLGVDNDMQEKLNATHIAALTTNSTMDCITSSSSTQSTYQVWDICQGVSQKSIFEAEGIVNKGGGENILEVWGTGG